MNILMLLYKPFPPDIRVEKEARSLIKAGHKVFVIGMDIAESLSFLNSITIININKSFIDSVMFRLTFVRPLLISKLKSIILNHSIDAIHVHDLPLVKCGYIAAKKFKLPVIADLHEIFPAAIIAYNKEKSFIKRVINKLFFNATRYRRYELSILNKVKKVILVAPESLKRFEGLLPRSKFEIVSNTFDPNEFTNNLSFEILNKYKDNFVILYIGGFGPHRGIDTTIKAIKHLDIANKKLLLVGGKGKYALKMKALANKLMVTEFIEFIDWVPLEKVESYIKASDICLVPHNNFEHTQTTVPHKLFQYMYLKKPVLVSDCAPLKRIIDDTNAGLVFRAEDDKDMADKIKYLYHSLLLEDYGLKGYNAVNNKYNWQEDEKSLLNIYYELIEYSAPFNQSFSTD